MQSPALLVAGSAALCLHTPPTLSLSARPLPRTHRCPLFPRLVQAGLAARGFEVLCLNTYDTLPVSRLDGAALAAAKQVAVVTVGSPSAIK